MTYTDRSRYQTYLDCPRRRWWAYEWGRGASSPAGGVTPIVLSMPLATGIYVHVGIAYLLENARGVLSGPLLPSEQILDRAVEIACSAYASEVATRGLAVEAGADADFTAREQVALCEALIRAYAAVELPALLTEYKVVEVECEREMVLTDANTSATELHWQSRADALLKQRATGDLYVLSLKTMGGAWDKRKEAENKHDVQGLSEAAAIEDGLAKNIAQFERQLSRHARFVACMLADEENPRDWDYIDSEYAKIKTTVEGLNTAPRKVDGILMQFLMKGDRRRQGADLDGDGTNLGKWEQHSPLVRARRRQKSDPITLEVCYEYAWSSMWRCSAPHPMRKSKWYPDGQCPGDGRRHKLGDDWEIFYVWEQVDPFRVWTPTGVREYPPGVAGWIQALNDTVLTRTCGCTVIMQPVLPVPAGFCPVCGAAFKPVPVIQPDAGPCLPTQFVTPPPYRRQQQDIDGWRRSASYQEAEIAEHSAIIREVEDSETRQHALDRLFPMNRRACDWPVSCVFTQICHESVLPAAQIDPLALGIYQPRQPHHEPEQRLAETGGQVK